MLFSQVTTHQKAYPAGVFCYFRFYARFLQILKDYIIIDKLDLKRDGDYILVLKFVKGSSRVVLFIHY